MRTMTGTGYPHDNLNQGQREAIDRLDAPPISASSNWVHIWTNIPWEGRGFLFSPRRRRTWTVYVKGYPVVRVYGKVVKE